MVRNLSWWFLLPLLTLTISYSSSTLITKNDTNFHIQLTTNGTPYYQLTEPMTIPTHDSSQYRYLKLNNELQVLIISDPTIRRSSLSLTLPVGTKSDPSPGLASLVAHTLVTESTRHPFGEFLKFLRDHWGYVDAKVHYEHTIFSMMMDNDALEMGMTYFSQSLSNSTFPLGGIAWTLEEDTNEIGIYSRSDIARTEQIQRVMSDTTHPFSAPSIGLKGPLRKRFDNSPLEVQQELMDFISKYYSANLMKLVVLGNDSIENLVNSAVDQFSTLINKNLTIPSYPGVPYKEDHLNKKIIVKPIKSTRTLDFHFLLPGMGDPSSLSYIEYLLGHEGKFTFNYQLKELGYATTILNRITKRFNEFAIYEISINLSPLGEIHHEKILSLLFQYIKLIKERGISIKFHKEIQEIKYLKTKYQEKLWPNEVTESLATLMLRSIPPQSLLTASYNMDTFDYNKILDVLDLFQYENLRITLTTAYANNRTDLQREPTLGGLFAVEPITKEPELSQVSFEIPQLNQFIPTNFKVLGDFNIKVLKRLTKRNNGVLWYYPGNFSSPISSIRLGFFNNAAHQSARTAVCLQILKELIRSRFRDILFSSQSAGVEFEVETTHNAIVIILNGYHQKITKVALRLVERLNQSQYSEANFAKATMEISKTLTSQKFSSIAQVTELTVYGMLEHNWSKEQKSKKLTEIDLVEMQKFSNYFFSGCYFQFLITGNVAPEDATSSFNDTIVVLNNTGTDTRTAIRSIALPNRSLVHRAPASDSHTNQSAIEFYVDTYAYSNLTARVLTEFTSFLINEPAFYAFSTKERLCSMSVTGRFSFSGRGGIRVIMMTRLDPNYVEKQIEKFLTEYTEFILNMGTEAFQNQIDSFLNIRLSPPASLNQVASKIWDQIISEFYDFDSSKFRFFKSHLMDPNGNLLLTVSLDYRITRLLRSLTPAALHHFLHQHLLATSPTRRKVSFQVVAPAYWSPPDLIRLPTPEPIHAESTPIPPPSPPPSSVPATPTDTEWTIFDLDAWKQSQPREELPEPYSDNATEFEL